MSEQFNPAVFAAALNMVADLRDRQRRYDEALNIYERSRQLQEKRENWEGVAYCQISIGGVYQHALKFDQAEEALNTAITICKEHNQRERLVLALGQMAELFLQQSNGAEGRTLVSPGAGKSRRGLRPDSPRAQGPPQRPGRDLAATVPTRRGGEGLQPCPGNPGAIVRPRTTLRSK